MEIKRKFDMTVETRRRYVIGRSAAADKQTACSICGAPELTAEQTAGFFGIKQRRLFQIIETGAVHFTETDAGTAMICIGSLTSERDDNTSKLRQEG